MALQRRTRKPHMTVTEQMIEELERAMLTEHRRELEALNLLKKRYANSKNGHSPVVAGAVAASPLGGYPIDNDVPLPMTMVERVSQIVRGHPEVSWDAPKMVNVFKSSGIPLKAERPLSTFNRIFRKLQKRGVVRLVRRGKGTGPNVYRAVATATDEAS